MGDGRWLQCGCSSDSCSGGGRWQVALGAWASGLQAKRQLQAGPRGYTVQQVQVQSDRAVVAVVEILAAPLTLKRASEKEK